MTAVGLAALAIAVLLAPTPGPTRRLALLVAAGRLHSRRRRVRRARPRSAGSPVGLVAAAGASVAVVITVCFGVLLGVAAGALVGTGGGVIAAAVSRWRSDTRRRHLIAAVRILVADVRSGSRAGPSLSAAAEVCPEYAAALRSAAEAAAVGEDPATVLLASGPAALWPLAQAWRVSSVSGAPLVDVLTRYADDLGAAESQHRAVAVALAGPRSSAALLSLLPAFGLVLGAAMGARPLVTLFTTGPGRLLCCVGVLLDVLGVSWTYALMRRAEGT
jgi:tight adherence protein B